MTQNNEKTEIQTLMMAVVQLEGLKNTMLALEDLYRELIHALIAQIKESHQMMRKNIVRLNVEMESDITMNSVMMEMQIPQLMGVIQDDSQMMAMFAQEKDLQLQIHALYEQMELLLIMVKIFEKFNEEMG